MQHHTQNAHHHADDIHANDAEISQDDMKHAGADYGKNVAAHLKGWHVFTKGATYGVIAVIALLALLALITL